MAHELAAVLMATATGGLINMDNAALSADKFSVAVIKAREVASLNESYQADPKADLRVRLNSRFDGLLGFLLSQFRSEPSDEDVRTVMTEKTPVNALNEEQVAGLPEGVVPVAIVRNLIRQQKISMDPRSLTNWRPFMQRYQSQVLSA